MSDDSWIAEVIVQFSRSPVWRTPVDNFIDENCNIFDNESEMKLKYTEVHRQFIGLIDTLLTNFVSELGVPPQAAMDSLHKALASKQTPIGEQVEKLVTYIYGAEDFMTFHRMMTRRNVELDILAMRALHEQGIEWNGDSAAPSSQYLSMRENNGYDEEEALRIAIQESLKDMTMSGKCLELEDAQLQEVLALSTQMEKEKAREAKLEVAKEVAILSQTDSTVAQRVFIEKNAQIDQRQAQNVMALEEKTLQMRQEKVREVVDQMHEEPVVPTSQVRAGAPITVQPPGPTSQTRAGAPITVQPPVPTSQQHAAGQAVQQPPPPTGKFGMSALPSLSLGQPPLSVLKEKAEAEKPAKTSAVAPMRQPTKEELEERSRYMREQREKILQQTKASRQQELQEYVKKNNGTTSSTVDPAEKQLTVDIARRLRGDILGELQK